MIARFLAHCLLLFFGGETDTLIFFGSIARQIEVAMEKHCQAQPWEILLRWVLNVLFMAKAL